MSMKPADVCFQHHKYQMKPLLLCLLALNLDICILQQHNYFKRLPFLFLRLVTFKTFYIYSWFGCSAFLVKIKLHPGFTNPF